MDLSAIDLLAVLGPGWAGKRVAATNGGEYAGACPFCGGHDRFRVWPQAGRWWCRQCGRKGDAIDLLRERDGLDYGEALGALGLAGDRAVHGPPASPSLAPRPPDWPAPPPAAWQEKAAAFAAWAEGKLWSDAGRPGLDYLHGRGLRDDTIRAAGLGYNPTTMRRSRESWGLPPDPVHPLHLPAGIVIPWRIGGRVWRLNIRRWEAGDGPKYYSPAGWGGAAPLYSADLLGQGRPVVLVESEFSALAIMQEAGDLVAAVATGSATGARALPWIARLAQAPLVLAAFDDDQAGEAAAGAWIEVLDNGKRWRPVGAKDPNDMLLAGLDLRGWIMAGLEHLGAGPRPPARSGRG